MKNSFGFYTAPLSEVEFLDLRESFLENYLSELQKLIYNYFKPAKKISYFINCFSKDSSYLEPQLAEVNERITRKCDELKKQYLNILPEEQQSEFYFFAKQTGPEDIKAFDSREMVKLASGVCFNKEIKEGLINFELVVSQSEKESVLIIFANEKQFEKMKNEQCKEYLGFSEILKAGGTEENLVSIVTLSGLVEKYFK